MRRRLIENLNASPAQVVLVTTGGGSRAISDILTVPGASQTVLEAIVPYSPESLCRFVGAVADQSCSAATARAMAMAAFQRARSLDDGLQNKESPRDSADDCLVGISCTASLATDRPKRGAHRAHVGVQTLDFSHTASLVLAKDKRSREEEEQIVANLILNQLAVASRIEDQIELKLIKPEEVTHLHTDAEPAWRELIQGKRTVVSSRTNDSDTRSATTIIFPGAFNPRHQAHTQMARYATERLGDQVDFELSIENVDKPLMDYTEIDRRLAQFTHEESVWLTRTATFVEKSLIFPNKTFVVGADTIVRIADPFYYAQDQQACLSAIHAIVDQGCRFLVFGRRNTEGFKTLSDLNLPPPLLAICDEVAEEEFRLDMSSTKLRENDCSY